MASNASAVMLASVPSASRRAAPLTQTRSGSKPWPLIRNGGPCAGSAASSASAVRHWRPGLKKAKHLPALSQTLLPALTEDCLELDELWSFVRLKANKQWVWLALCRRTRQIVAYAVGDRSEVTCRRLWQRVPPAYRRGVCFTDFWEAYAKVIPPDQHCPGGKGAGQTNHIERWNNTLRQRLARFVRETLSFSKKRLMHKVCLILFIHCYNRECAAKYNNQN